VGAEWRRLRAEGTDTVLDPIAPELSDLPWELAWTGAEYVFGTAPEASRYHTPRPADPPDREWPLRLLILLGAPGDLAVKGESEIRRIRADLLWRRHTVDIEVAVSPTAQNLADTLRAFRPHVIHFIGHGGISRQSGLPVLYVSGTPAWEIDGPTISGLVANTNVRPCFVFLNACRSSDERKALTVARAFANAGVQATLAMQ